MSRLQSCSGHSFHAPLFVDSYGQTNELETIREWWPSRAERWFESRQQDWSRIAKKTPPKSQTAGVCGEAGQVRSQR